MKGYSRSRQDFLELLYAKYRPMEEIENGCLGLGAKDTDYKLTEGLLDALPTLYQQDEKIYEYNQFNQKRSQKSCTMFSAMGALSDLFNYEFSLNEMKEWDNESYNHGRKQGEGWRVQLAVDLCCKLWNEKHSDLGKVAYYSIDLKDNSLLKGVLDKKYTVCTGYNGNATYNNDKNKDGILNGTDFGKSTYGHAISTIWSTKYPARVKDNYKGIPYNIYEVAHEFSEIPCFFARGFVFTKVAEDNLERIKKLNEMRTKILNGMETNSDLWNLSGSQAHKDKLHDMNNFYRDRLNYIDNELKTLM